MMIWLSSSKAQPVGKWRVRAMEIACPLWPGATGVETELALPLSITARGALQKLLSYTHICMASSGLAGGSVTSSGAPRQQLAFTTLYSFMKYILTWHVILWDTMETQSSHSAIWSQKRYGSWCSSAYLNIAYQIIIIRNLVKHSCKINSLQEVF